MIVQKFAEKYRLALTDVITEETTHVIIKTGTLQTFTDYVVFILEATWRAVSIKLSIPNPDVQNPQLFDCRRNIMEVENPTLHVLVIARM